MLGAPCKPWRAAKAATAPRQVVWKSGAKAVATRVPMGGRLTGSSCRVKRWVLRRFRGTISAWERTSVDLARFASLVPHESR